MAFLSSHWLFICKSSLKTTINRRSLVASNIIKTWRPICFNSSNFIVLALLKQYIVINVFMEARERSNNHSRITGKRNAGFCFFYFEIWHRIKLCSRPERIPWCCSISPKLWFNIKRSQNWPFSWKHSIRQMRYPAAIYT